MLAWWDFFFFFVRVDCLIPLFYISLSSEFCRTGCPDATDEIIYINQSCVTCLLCFHVTDVSVCLFRYWYLRRRGSGHQVGMREDQTPAAPHREQNLQDDAGRRYSTCWTQRPHMRSAAELLLVLLWTSRHFWLEVISCRPVGYKHR